MNGDDLFAVIFIFMAMIGGYIAMFLDVGGGKKLAEVVTRIINSHVNKKKDI